MSRNSRAVAGFICSCMVMLAACGDSITAPREPAVASSAERRALLDFLVSPVERSSPLPADVSWTFTAGPEGGWSRNGAVGLTVIVPPGALAETVEIRVTALQGSAVAYRFEPHLTFQRNVTLRQDLWLTQAGLLTPIVGAHFAGDVPEFINGMAVVTETVPSLLSLLTRTVRFDVSHFSGWIVASGREELPPPEGY